MYNYRIKEILKVIDGDTVEVLVDLGFSVYHKTRVRLIGIDTPEIRTKDQEEKERGLEALDFIVDYFRMMEHEEKVLESEKLDGFGRSLGRIIVGGVDIGEELLNSGHAKPYERK
jgi:micrococcal nuclease